MPKYLVLEDDNTFVNNTYKPAERDSKGGATPIELVFAATVGEARARLATERFSGAILDLRLSGADHAEGNEVAKQIHRDYFMPIAIVTGFADELEESLREIAEGGSTLVRVFNKNAMIAEVFQFLLRIEQSGVLQIVGPGGEINQMLSDIFWKHLGPVIAQWAGEPLPPQDRKRVLRHAVAHMVSALQTSQPTAWDKYHPAEVYIWPPICPIEMTGDIYVRLEDGHETDQFSILVTPACDIASKTTPGAVRHFVNIRPFSAFPNEGKTANMIAKKEFRYHILPPGPTFQGGVADFASLSASPALEVEQRFLRKGTLIEPYWRELVSRLGTWLARQGTPEFDKDPLMASIRAQWPPAPPTAGKATN